MSGNNYGRSRYIAGTQLPQQPHAIGVREFAGIPAVPCTPTYLNPCPVAQAYYLGPLTKVFAACPPQVDLSTEGGMGWLRGKPLSSMGWARLTLEMVSRCVFICCYVPFSVVAAVTVAAVVAVSALICRYPYLWPNRLISITTIVPLPTSEKVCMLPPCRRAIPLATLSPSP